jgi:hypothetical protein
MVRYLYDEPHFLLQQEVSGVGSYFSIIKAIAAGNHKLSAIAAVLEVKSTNLTKYLKTLMDLDIGVYLDSTLLENLTAKEREQMVKERVKELGGQHFTAYDGNGNTVDVQIAAPNARFVNKNGKSVPVNKDLATKNRGSRIKQEAVVLADELVSAARYKKSRPANYPHGWLDDNGRNKWAEWKTYIQDKENSVWEATLHIATSATGEKFLYDIDPIKMAEQSGNSDTSTANDRIPADGENVKPQFSLKAPVEAEKKGHVKSAKEFFGETNNWNEAGYITTDGTKLDFSGRHEGAPGGQTGRRGRRSCPVTLAALT